MWLIVSGAAFMLAAVIQDPWGRDWRMAATFLLGAALLVIGVAS